MTIYRWLRRHKFWLFVAIILLFGLVLRLVQLTAHDVYTDEAFYAFRGIGLIDYVSAVSQLSPWQWGPTVPAWMHISFHDHPIVFFLIEHVFIALFGGIDLLFAVRLPAVLLGVGTLFFTFLITRRLFSEKVAMVSLLLLAVSSYHVWISQVALQDGAALFFMMLAFYAWLVTLEKRTWWSWSLWGIALALAVLTKYTSAIVVMFMVVHALLFARDVYTEKLFWLGVGVFFVGISPIWIYNMLLFRLGGHFDLQLALFLGQETPRWPTHVGRELSGNFFKRFSDFVPVLRSPYSVVMQLGIVVGFGSLVMDVIRKRQRSLILLLAILVVLWGWFLIIGSQLRFMTMLIPWIAILVSLLLVKLLEKKRYVLWSVVGLFCLFELFFTVNTFFIHPSIGKQGLTYSRVQEKARNFGFNQLDAYLDRALDGKVSALFGQPDYQFLADVQESYLAQAKEDEAVATPMLIIYESNINFVATLWVLHRRAIYEAWPIVSDETFFEIAGDAYDSYYRAQGVTQFMYIRTRADVVRQVRKPEEPTAALTDYLEQKGIIPEIIRNADGEEAFAVYRW